MGTGGFEFGGDVDGNQGGGADRGGGDTDGKETATEDYLSGQDTVVTTTLGTEPNDPLVYAPGLELHHPIMSKLGEHGGQ